MLKLKFTNEVHRWSDSLLGGPWKKVFYVSKRNSKKPIGWQTLRLAKNLNLAS